MWTRRHFLIAAAAANAAAQERPAAPPPVGQTLSEIPQEAPREGGQAPAPFGGAQWKIAHFHDESTSALALVDFIAVPGVALAAGVVQQRRGRPQNVALVSRDAGKTWITANLPAQPTSVFALDAENFWLVSGNRLYFTSDPAGRWTRLRLPRKAFRVCFVTPQTGFAYGAGKVFHRTTDGGRRWTAVPESQNLSLTDANTTFFTMEFADGRIGVLAGNSRRLDTESLDKPLWVAPEQAMARRPRPATTAMLSTLDGGATWTPSVTSAFGDVVRLRLARARSVALFEYGEGMAFPTEVFVNTLPKGGTKSLFRRKLLRVTDVLMLGDEGYLLGCVEPYGRLAAPGIPGRVRLVYSPNGADWYQTPVDYRAVAEGVLLAQSGDGLLAALPTGMILRLES